MITGRRILKQIYPNLDEEQYQPAGVDLTLDKVAGFVHNVGTTYGLTKKAKVLPQQKELKTVSMQVAGMITEVFVLKPHTSYIATTTEKVKISKYAGQFYLPRSSLLRAGIDVRTAFGDPGFEGHLSFLLINHTDDLFVIEKGARFAQLVDMSADNVDEEYDGDYNE